MAGKLYSEFTASIVNTLESLGIVYAIGGSFASIAYSEIRTTADIDISIVLTAAEIMAFVNAMQALEYYVTFDDVLEALMYKQPFNVLDPESGFKADMFIMEPTPLEESILARKRRIVYDSSTNAAAVLYSPEDVILYKMKYYLMGKSQKHLRDIAAMLATQGEALDYDYIERWANEIGVIEVWHQILDAYQRRSP